MKNFLVIILTIFTLAAHTMQAHAQSKVQSKVQSKQQTQVQSKVQSQIGPQSQSQKPAQPLTRPQAQTNDQTPQQPEPQLQIITNEFVFNNPPFKSCHASSLVQLKNGSVLAAWFAGQQEGHKEVGIWSSINTGGKWSKPVKVADGRVKDTLTYACWNPVLFRTAANHLFLFYKVGPSPREWWGVGKSSKDNGKTWSAPVLLPAGFLGPIKNKPVQLADGTILYPSSVETTADNKWTIHLEKSDQYLGNWKKITIDCDTFGVIQPTILQYPGNKLQMLCRSRQNAVVETWSTDNGETWSPLQKTEIVNPNSGIDAVTTKSGLQVLVYNPIIAGQEWYNGRNRLAIATSKDGKDWKDVHQLEDQPKGEFSYPAIITDNTGRVYITYTYDRKNIKYVVAKVE